MAIAWQLLSLAVLAVAPTPCAVTLVDVAAASGIDFVHQRGDAGAKRLPETMGAGVAWLDYDGDGWLDLYAMQSGPLPGAVPEAERAAAANRLYRNLGAGADGWPRFEDVTDAARAGERGYGQGVVAGDLDGDGQSDLYVANYGPDAVLINRGDGTFETRAAPAAAAVWSSSAALGDVDGDGDLDLYVVRYLDYDLGHDLFCGDAAAGERAYCGPELFAGAADSLYRNRGDGTFEEVTAAAGLGDVDGKGLGVAFIDLDLDGRLDLYVANDQTLNFLFRNRGDGTFEDLSLVSGAAVDGGGLPQAGMGIASGDLDGDGWPELAVTNFDVETNTLYRNLQAMQFADASAPSGFGPPSFNLLGFGIVLADLDRDGDLDAYVANGHVRERTRRENVTYAERDLVLLGDGAGRFREASCALGTGAAMVGRGLAAADLDHDGDPDLAVSNSGARAQLLRNASPAGPWLGLRLRTASGADAVGARVHLRTDGGEQVRAVSAGDSYQSSGDPRLVFGLGTATVRELTITWPSGRRQVLRAPPTEVYLELREPAG